MANLDTTPITALLERIVPIPPPPAGLGTLMSLPGLSEATKARLQALLTRYSDRINFETTARRDLAEAVAAVEALLAHGYPEEPVGDADAEMLTELDSRLYAMQAARSKFRRDAETT
jgi:hypothetical protein